MDVVGDPKDVVRIFPTNRERVCLLHVRPDPNLREEWGRVGDNVQLSANRDLLTAKGIRLYFVYPAGDLRQRSGTS